MADTRYLAAWAAGPACFEAYLREADVETELSDLEYGRRWAAMMGKRPDRDRHKGFGWWVFQGEDIGGPHVLPRVLLLYLAANGWSEWVWSKVEADAYAALGAAVRAVHKAVPPVAARDPEADHEGE